MNKIPFYTSIFMFISGISLIGYGVYQQYQITDTDESSSVSDSDKKSKLSLKEMFSTLEPWLTRFQL